MVSIAEILRFFPYQAGRVLRHHIGMVSIAAAPAWSRVFADGPPDMPVSEAEKDLVMHVERAAATAPPTTSGSQGAVSPASTR